MIIPNEIQTLLKELSTTSHGKALIAYLEQAIDDVGDIRKTSSWEETQGRQFAVKIFEDLLAHLDDGSNGSKKRTKYY